MNAAEIRRLFDYNEWANARLLRVVAGLTIEQFTKDLRSSFASIRDTFAHIVAAEWIWLQRWEGVSPRSAPEWSVSPTPQVLHDRLSELEAERRPFLASLRDEDLQRHISYTNLKNEQWRYALGDALVHLVNHSTYHRGQVVTMLRQVGASAVATDLLVFRDEGRVMRDG